MVILFLYQYPSYTLPAYAMLDILFYAVFYLCAQRTKNKLVVMGHHADANVIRCYRTGLTSTLIIGFIGYGAYTPYFIQLQKIPAHLHWMYVPFVRFDS